MTTPADDTGSLRTSPYRHVEIPGRVGPATLAGCGVRPATNHLGMVHRRSPTAARPQPDRSPTAARPTPTRHRLPCANLVTRSRYNDLMNTPSADTPPPRRQCGWCTGTLSIVRRPGRPRIYCTQSCRQRAYERRRGLGVLPPPDRIIMTDGGPLAHLPSRSKNYERGEIRILQGRAHAMRPAGITERGERRLTLCGLLARPVTRPFDSGGHESCRTCAAVERVRPPARPIRLSPDLAALRSLLDQAAVEACRSPRSKYPMRPTDQILFELLEAVI